MKEQKAGKTFSPLFYFLLLSSLALYIWIFSNTPYGQDDWHWGIDYGMNALLTGSINSRYLGNLLEVIVTRSGFLKAVLHGLIAAAIPFFIVLLVRTEVRPGPELVGKASRLPEAVLLLSNTLLLTLPIDVWKETYGWIAGFSNFGFAVFFLGAFQLLLSRIVLDEVPRFSWTAGLGYFLFGLGIQLVLENMTIYVFLVDVLLLIIMLLEKRSKAAKRLMLLMLAGNAVGLFIMFSSSIYTSLFDTGKALGGYRTLAFDPHDSLYNIFLVLNQRFMYFYPHRIFGNNWLMCSVISLLLFLLSGRRKGLIRFGISMFALFYFVYFAFTHFYGLLEYHISRWNEMYTQWLNILFFWGVLLSVLLLPWEGTRIRKVLIFVWLSVLGILLPLVAVKIVGSRYFLFSSLFLIEFGMFLLAEVYKDRGKQLRVAEGFILLAFLFVGIHKFSIYYDIGQAFNERMALIRAAQNGETDRLYFEDLPHKEYIEINEPLDGSEHVGPYREFYHIPDSVEMHNSLEDFSPEK